VAPPHTLWTLQCGWTTPGPRTSKEGCGASGPGSEVRGGEAVSNSLFTCVAPGRPRTMDPLARLATTGCVPRGTVRGAAVRLDRSECAPLAVGRPCPRLPSHDARPLCPREGGREGSITIRRDPSTPDPTWALETPGPPKTRLTTSTEPVRNGTKRGSLRFREFFPYGLHRVAPEAHTSPCVAVFRTWSLVEGCIKAITIRFYLCIAASNKVVTTVIVMIPCAMAAR
jgi:hypothetical protein